VTPAELCGTHSRIAFDSHVFICLFEAAPQRGPIARALVLEAELRGIRLVASTVAVAETAVGPVRQGDEAMAVRYADAMRSIGNLDIVPVSAEIALDAAVYRGRLRIALTDAIHLATARAAGATVLVTNDRRLPPVPHVEIVVLDDLELDEGATAR
jgi:predicted nucleic acid-binding protein